MMESRRSVLWKYFVVCEDDESKAECTCIRFLFPINNYLYLYSYLAEFCSELFGTRPNTENSYSVQP